MTRWYLPAILAGNLITIIDRDIEGLGSPVYTTKAHGAIINAIDGIGGLGIGGGAPEIVTGSRDGKAGRPEVGLIII